MASFVTSDPTETEKLGLDSLGKVELFFYEFEHCNPIIYQRTDFCCIFCLKKSPGFAYFFTVTFSLIKQNRRSNYNGVVFYIIYTLAALGKGFYFALGDGIVKYIMLGFSE